MELFPVLVQTFSENFCLYLSLEIFFLVVSTRFKVSHFTLMSLINFDWFLWIMRGMDLFSFFHMRIYFPNVIYYRGCPTKYVLTTLSRNKWLHLCSFSSALYILFSWSASMLLCQHRVTLLQWLHSRIWD